MTAYSEIGKSVIFPDVITKARGAALYASDMALPGMLHGKILRSKYPHARLLSIDTDKAKHLPGVRAVITAADLPQNRWGLLLKDKAVFALDMVRFVGDDIAGVAAIDPETAEEALELIKVEYEELPAVFDAAEAMKPDAPIIHENLKDYVPVAQTGIVPGSNINAYRKLRRGNVDAGFKEADYIFEDEYKVPAICAAAFESMVCVASADSAGNITVWSSTQTPYEVRDIIADYLKIPFNKVRIIVSFLGGGFGSKLNMKGELACVLMSKFTGQPVKLDYTREEVFIAGGRRPPLSMKIKAGVKKDGAIVAMQCTNIWDSGAYADHAPRIAMRGLQSGGGPYKVPNISIDSYTVYTNNPPSTAYRGYGANHVTWAVESHLDMVSRKLGIDPLEMRLRNAVEEGDSTPTGQIAHAVGVKECLLSLKEKGWGKPRTRKPYTGVGISCFHKPTNTPTAAGAFVKVNQDGSADLLISSVDMGQGSHTTLAQMVAEELGIATEKVRVAMPDTQMTPYYGGTAGSRTNFVLGNAVKGAAVAVKKQVLDLAAAVLETPVENLELRGGKVWVKGTPGKELPISNLPIGGGKFAAGAGHPVLGGHAFSSASKGTTPDPETGQAKKTAVFWMYGAQMVEIEVDPDTGKIKINRIVSAHNVGKILNPLLLEGQCEGGIIMAMGETLTEQQLYENGAVINPNFRDYKIPSFGESVKDIECVWHEIPHQDAPYGNLGFAEAPSLGVSSAVANALYDAIGVRIRELPLTAEKVLMAIREKQEPAKLKRPNHPNISNKSCMSP